MLSSLGRLAYARRRVVALIWLGVLVTGLAAGGGVFSRLDTGLGLRDDTEAAVAERRLADLGVAGPDVLVLLDGMNAEDPRTRASVSDFAEGLRSLRDVRSVTEAAPTTAAAALVSADHRAQLVAVTLRRGIALADRERVVDQITERARQSDAERALVGGAVPAQLEFQRSSQRDLRIGELIAFPLILRLLVIVFRGFVAPIVPLVVAGVSVAGTLVLLLGVSQVAKLSTFSVNLVTMVGLGLAVDYSLLMVSRFREERAAGAGMEESIVATVATAGRTVAFSGLTAAVAMAGLLVFAEPLLRSMAWGAIGVVILSVAATLTLLPALLGFWGSRIKPARSVAADGGQLYRVARRAQRAALIVVPAVAVGLVLLAAPFRDIHQGGSGPSTLAAGSPSRELFETVRDRFPGGGSDPIVVLAEAGPDSVQIATLVDRIDEMPGAAAVAVRPGSPAGLTVIDVSYEGPGSSAAAQGLVRQIRAMDAAPEVQVTGPSAHLFDFKTSVAQRLPYALGLIVLASFVLLFVMTGSVVIPLKAIAMNVLSLGASFGALVWIFIAERNADPEPPGHRAAAHESPGRHRACHRSTPSIPCSQPTPEPPSPSRSMATTTTRTVSAPRMASAARQVQRLTESRISPPALASAARIRLESTSRSAGAACAAAARDGSRRSPSARQMAWPSKPRYAGDRQTEQPTCG